MKAQRRQLLESVTIGDAEYPLNYGSNAEDKQVMPCLTLQEEVYRRLCGELEPGFLVSPRVPFLPHTGFSSLANRAVALSQIYQILFQDQELRHRALPPWLHKVPSANEFALAGLAFDFFVGRNLESPKLLECAAYGSDMVMSAVMLDTILGTRSYTTTLMAWWKHLVEGRLASKIVFPPAMLFEGTNILAWWQSLVKPLMVGKRLHFVTSIGELNHTRDGEHLFQMNFLREVGVEATSGSAEEVPNSAETVYLRFSLMYPQGWNTIKGTHLWKRVLAGDVRLIPPIGNSFVSSKVVLPVLADASELRQRGVPENLIKVAGEVMPATFLYQRGMYGWIARSVAPTRPLWLKSAWNYGGFGTRRVSSADGLAKALYEIETYGEGPIIAQEEIPPSYLPADSEREIPEQRVEVRVRVFDHGSAIKAVPPIPSVRLYGPDGGRPQVSILLSRDVLPQQEKE